jgi:hypothetical protein
MDARSQVQRGTEEKGPDSILQIASTLTPGASQPLVELYERAYELDSQVLPQPSHSCRLAPTAHEVAAAERSRPMIQIMSCTDPKQILIGYQT